MVFVVAAADVYVGIYGRGAEAGDAQLRGERCEGFQSSAGRFDGGMFVGR